MANKDYSYDDVLANKGYYQKETSPVYVAGVETLQKRLIACGYTLTADGKFGQGTHDAVLAYQKGVSGLTEDGKAGQGTLKHLDKVYTSTYFTTYGTPLLDTDWGPTTVSSGSYNNKKVLARVIYAEDTKSTKGQSAVALTIKRRTSSTKKRAGVTDPWIAVVTFSGAYGTIDRGTQNAQYPVRGDSSATDGIHPMWKQAVNLAINLVDGVSISAPTGYKLNSTTTDTGGRTTTSQTYANQLFQIGNTKYKDWCNDASYKSKIKNAMCFYSSSDTPSSYNVFLDLDGES